MSRFTNCSIHWDLAPLKKRAFQTYPPNNTIEISEELTSDGEVYRLSLFDGTGAEIESVVDRQLIKHFPVAAMGMKQLYLAARRVSNNVDKQIDEIMSALQ